MAVLALAVLLIGCSKEEPRVSDNSIEVVESQQAPVVNLDLEINQDVSALDTELRALEFNSGTATVAPKLTHSEKSVPVRFYIRSTDASQPITEVVLNVKRTSGRSTLKLKQLGVTMAAKTDLKKGTWYITGIIGGAATAGKPVVFGPTNTTKVNVADNAKTSLEIPMLAPWTKLNFLVNANGVTETKPVSALVFKPQGALLRLKTTNRGRQSVVVNYYTIRSQSFKFQWTYNPRTTPLEPNKIPALASSTTESATIAVNAGTLAPAGKTSYSFVWVMPVATATKGMYTTVETHSAAAVANSNLVYSAFHRTASAGAKKVYDLKCEVKDVPLSWLAESVWDGSTISASSSTTAKTSGRIQYNKYATLTAPTGFHKMAQGEQGIVWSPSTIDLTKTGQEQTITHQTLFNGSTTTYTDKVWIAAGGGVGYAIRFAAGDNKYRSVYRFSTTDNTIKAIPLQNSFTGTVADFANEGYWSSEAVSNSVTTTKAVRDLIEKETRNYGYMRKRPTGQSELTFTEVIQGAYFFVNWNLSLGGAIWKSGQAPHQGTNRFYDYLVKN